MNFYVLKAKEKVLKTEVFRTFRGGDKKGGVYLDKKYLYQGKIRSRDELQIISQALELLQKSGSDVDQTVLASLIQEYKLPNQAGEIAQ